MSADTPRRWLTYADAGERLGIGAASVKRRAQRAGWPRQESNTGLALVGVPEELLAEREPATPPATVAGDTAPPSPPPEAGGFLGAMAEELRKLAEDARQARAGEAEAVAKLAAAERELAQLRALMLEPVSFTERQAPPPGFRVVRSGELYHWHRLADGTLGPARPDRWSARRGAFLAHRQASRSSS